MQGSEVAKPEQAKVEARPEPVAELRRSQD
jgi:hypothetical protein